VPLKFEFWPELSLVRCLQGQLGAVRQYSGAIDAFQKIVSNEGVTALWKGLSPALVRQSTYGSLRYGLYAPMKKALVPDGNKETMFTKITAGAVAGAIASAIANPTGGR
jgi:Mitochondrial carrier protein